MAVATLVEGYKQTMKVTKGLSPTLIRGNDTAKQEIYIFLLVFFHGPRWEKKMQLDHNLSQLRLVIGSVTGSYFLHTPLSRSLSSLALLSSQLFMLSLSLSLYLVLSFSLLYFPLHFHPSSPSLSLSIPVFFSLFLSHLFPYFPPPFPLRIITSQLQKENKTIKKQKLYTQANDGNQENG